MTQFTRPCQPRQSKPHQTSPANKANSIREPRTMAVKREGADLEPSEARQRVCLVLLGVHARRGVQLRNVDLPKRTTGMSRNASTAVHTTAT